MEGYFVERTSMKLAHHGILGMKWGIRRYQSYDTVPRGSGKGGKEIGAAKSAKGNAYRLAAKVYSLNEKTYNKLGNKTLASMNEDAKNRMNKAASEADKKASEKRMSKLNDYKNKRIDKLNKRISEYKKQKKEYDDATKDLKEYGVSSKTFKDAKDRALRFTPKHERAAKAMMEYGLFAGVKVNDLIDENNKMSKNFSRYINSGKKIVNEFSNFEINETTRKSDLRRASRI